MNVLDFRFEMKDRDGCPLCGDKERAELLALETPVQCTAHYYTCAGCRLIYMDPIPTGDSLDHFYRNIYSDPEYRKIDGHAYSDPRQEFLAAMPSYEHHLDRIERYRRPPGRMIDVGCAYGGIIFEAATRGWHRPATR